MKSGRSGHYLTTGFLQPKGLGLHSVLLNTQGYTRAQGRVLSLPRAGQEAAGQGDRW